MDFFKRLFSSKKESVGPLDSKTGKESVGEEDVEKRKDDFIQLAEAIIEVDHPEIVKTYSEKLDQFRSNPTLIFDGDEYYYDTTNNEFQAYRGNSSEIRKNIEWFLLIDTLQFNTILRELDWKTDHEETTAVLMALANFKGYPLADLNDFASLEMESLEEFLKVVNMKLERHQLVAINLYIDSDSYVTGLVKSQHLDEIIRKAGDCGQKVTPY